LKIREVKLYMVDQYLVEYAKTLSNALLSVDGSQITAATETLRKAYLTNRSVFVCGNGGSAAISDHFHCDHSKGVCFDTDLKPKIQALSSNLSTITAIANDFSYDEIFSYQLQMKAITGDVLVTVSSSGNSPNIIRAIEEAKKLKMTVIALCGFDGGKSAELADIVLHVKEDNYGIVEDAHQSLMHVMAQFIRLTHINKDIDDIKL
jgi:D-sedoheptulose 7-phosphate isomerase